MMTDEVKTILEQKISEQLGTPCTIFRGESILTPGQITAMVRSREEEQQRMAEANKMRDFHRAMADVCFNWTSFSKGLINATLQVRGFDRFVRMFLRGPGKRRTRRHSFKSRRHIRGPQFKAEGKEQKS